MLTRLSKMLLEFKGHKVFVCDCSESAYGNFLRNEYDVYILDYCFGAGLNGKDLAREMRKIRPASVIVLMSIQAPDTDLSVFDMVIDKPITEEELEEVLLFVEKKNKQY